MGSGAQMGSGARRMRARFGPGTWNPPRHAETDDDEEESLEAEMADDTAEENPPLRHAATVDVDVVPDAVKEQGASYDVIADEAEAGAAREDGVEMSDDGRNASRIRFGGGCLC
ncbi:hypothetical protein PF008_g5312 [Phytophthora fragariae]|uniref:Uncharacterized protein n=1 Tax=Phytophthora fragariae TaxID=53985 RepID=A0A6G0S9D0_9STRA|nr:hypothetical protein PF008_g5312 [Phytophthora fragariae]